MLESSTRYGEHLSPWKRQCPGHVAGPSSCTGAVIGAECIAPRRTLYRGILMSYFIFNTRDTMHVGPTIPCIQRRWSTHRHLYNLPPKKESSPGCIDVVEMKVGLLINIFDSTQWSVGLSTQLPSLSVRFVSCRISNSSCARQRISQWYPARWSCTCNAPCRRIATDRHVDLSTADTAGPLALSIVDACETICVVSTRCHGDAAPHSDHWALRTSSYKKNTIHRGWSLSVVVDAWPCDIIMITILMILTT